MHRDLKPENVLIYNLDEEKDFIHIKLVDFGFASSVNKTSAENQDKQFDKIGTPAYMAPELMCDTNEGHSNGVDIWALGVMAFYLLSGGLHPFIQSGDDEEIQIDDLKQKILNDEPNWDLLKKVCPEA